MRLCNVPIAHIIAATTLDEVLAARAALEAWLLAHPDDLAILDYGTRLENREYWARQPRATGASVPAA